MTTTDKPCAYLSPSVRAGRKEKRLVVGKCHSRGP